VFIVSVVSGSAAPVRDHRMQPSGAKTVDTVVRPPRTTAVAISALPAGATTHTVISPLRIIQPTTIDRLGSILARRVSDRPPTRQSFACSLPIAYGGSAVPLTRRAGRREPRYARQ